MLFANSSGLLLALLTKILVQLLTPPLNFLFLLPCLLCTSSSLLAALPCSCLLLLSARPLLASSLFSCYLLPSGSVAARLLSLLMQQSLLLHPLLLLPAELVLLDSVQLPELMHLRLQAPPLLLVLLLQSLQAVRLQAVRLPVTVSEALSLSFQSRALLLMLDAKPLMLSTQCLIELLVLVTEPLCRLFVLIPEPRLLRLEPRMLCLEPCFVLLPLVLAVMMMRLILRPLCLLPETNLPLLLLDANLHLLPQSLLLPIQVASQVIAASVHVEIVVRHFCPLAGKSLLQGSELP
mmetsp:Transcript_137454/g.242923  ORF Transcript_137454/g.242923 Transcript_137454/m.242923 type:complete len:293 (+) Transcript_137454:678-1556(+)